MLICTRPRLREFGVLLVCPFLLRDKLQIKDMKRSGPDPNQAVSAVSTVMLSLSFLLWGCLHPMPMDFSGLLRRLLTDCHIDFTSFKGWCLACRWISPVLLLPAADRQPHLVCRGPARHRGLLAFALATCDIQLTVLSPSVVVWRHRRDRRQPLGPGQNLAMISCSASCLPHCAYSISSPPLALAIGLGLHLPLRDGGVPRPTLRHHQLWPPADCHLHHAGAAKVPDLLSAAGPCAGALVRPGVPGLALAAP